MIIVYWREKDINLWYIIGGYLCKQIDHLFTKQDSSGCGYEMEKRDIHVIQRQVGIICFADLKVKTG